MRIKAIYDNGIIKPLEPLNLTKKAIQVEIIIPDGQIETGSEIEAPTAMRKEIDTILGQYAYTRPAVTPAEDKQVWHQHLEEKYGS